MKQFFCFILGLGIAWLLCLVLDRPYSFRREDVTVQRDTVVDTVRIVQPIAKDSVVLRYKIVKAPILKEDSVSFTLNENLYAENGDSCVILAQADSVDVVLPITQRHYADTLYEAWVSGYDAGLDSIRVYAPTVTVRIHTPPPRWGLGISAGIAATPKGIQPYIGVGITYNIFSR